MRRHVVRSPQAPQVSAASQAISVEVVRTTYVSGQRPDDPTAPLTEQVRQVMDNVERVLESAGLGLESLQKVTLYLTDLADLFAVDEVYSVAFVRPPPARTVVQVAALEGGSRIMIDGVAGA